MRKIAYFDCIAGASGDMILGALVDAGLPVSDLQERLQALHLADFELRSRRVFKNAFAATKVDVWVSDTVPERHLGDILEIIKQSDLTQEIKDTATDIFRKIGVAEAGIHGTNLEEVHLHELGGVDTIVDVVGALVGLDALEVDYVVVSPIPLGRGFIRGAHGPIPLPAPATVALLKGVPVVGSPLEMETVTPTGAALLASLADDFGPIPPMKVTAVGYGAGSRDLPVPNVMRLLIGTGSGASEVQHSHGPSHGRAEGLHHDAHGHGHAPHRRALHEHGHAGHLAQSDHSHEHTHPPQTAREARAAPHAVDEAPHPHSHNQTHSCLDTDTLRVLETNIDDLNPEFYEYVMDRLFAAGTLDVFFSPIQMKKNRPAVLLRVLCQPDDVETMTAILFAETTTLGVREQTVARHALRRSVEAVETPYGAVHVKVAELGDGRVKSAPEYEDCRNLAQANGVPLREVYQAAQEAAQREFGG